MNIKYLSLALTFFTLISSSILGSNRFCTSIEIDSLGSTGNYCFDISGGDTSANPIGNLGGAFHDDPEESRIAHNRHEGTRAVNEVRRRIERIRSSRAAAPIVLARNIRIRSTTHFTPISIHVSAPALEDEPRLNTNIGELPTSKVREILTSIESEDKWSLYAKMASTLVSSGKHEALKDKLEDNGVLKGERINASKLKITGTKSQQYLQRLIANNMQLVDSAMPFYEYLDQYLSIGMASALNLKLGAELIAMNENSSGDRLLGLALDGSSYLNGDSERAIGLPSSDNEEVPLSDRSASDEFVKESVASFFDLVGKSGPRAILTVKQALENTEGSSQEDLDREIARIYADGYLSPLEQARFLNAVTPRETEGVRTPKFTSKLYGEDIDFNLKSPLERDLFNTYADSVEKMSKVSVVSVEHSHFSTAKNIVEGAMVLGAKNNESQVIAMQSIAQGFLGQSYAELALTIKNIINKSNSFQKGFGITTANNLNPASLLYTLDLECDGDSWCFAGSLVADAVSVGIALKGVITGALLAAEGGAGLAGSLVLIPASGGISLAGAAPAAAAVGLGVGAVAYNIKVASNTLNSLKGKYLSTQNSEKLTKTSEFTKVVNEIGIKTVDEIRNTAKFLKDLTKNKYYKSQKIKDLLNKAGAKNLKEYSRTIEALKKEGHRISPDANEFIAGQVLNSKSILKGESFVKDDLIRIGKRYDELSLKMNKVTPIKVDSKVWRAVQKNIRNSDGAIVAVNHNRNVFDFHPGVAPGNGRYSAPGDSALYTSLGMRERARRTVMAELGDSANQELVFTSKHYKLDKVLDLTDLSTRKSLDLDILTITKDSVKINDAYEVTHQIGNIAIKKGFKAIKVPSAADKGGTNLIILRD